MNKEMKEAIKAEKIDNEYKQFDYFSVHVVDSKKLRNKLSKLLVLVDYVTEKEDAKDTEGDYIACMDKTHCCLVHANSPEGNEALSEFNISERIPKLDNLVTAKSRYGLDYLKTIIDIFSEFDDNGVEISIGDDSPMIMSNEHLSIILAPRIEND